MYIRRYVVQIEFSGARTILCRTIRRRTIRHRTIPRRTIRRRTICRRTIRRNGIIQSYHCDELSGHHFEGKTESLGGYGYEIEITPSPAPS